KRHAFLFYASGRDVARLFDAGAPRIGGQPVVEPALGAVGGGVGPDDGVEVVAQGVLLGGDGVVCGLHPFHRQQAQPRLGIHLVYIIVDRKADGVGTVVVGGHAVHQPSHGGGGQLGGGLHQLPVPDQQVLEQGLAAAVPPPLEGHDGRVGAAHLAPVGDPAGVNVPQLAEGQALDRV